MAGLLELLGGSTGDPKRDAAINQGILQMGLQMLQSKGSFGQALGQGGMAGIQAANQTQDRQFQQEQQQQTRMQWEEQQRQLAQQQKQRELMKQFYKTPEQTALAGGGGPTTANAQKIGAPSYDFQGYAEALAQYDPMASMELKQRLAKPTRKLTSVAPGASLVDEATGQPVYSAPDRASAEPESLRALKAIYGEGTPEYLAAAQRLGAKMTTHQPGVNVTYGAPVAGVDAEGKPVYFQPDKAGGKPAIIPGVAPPPKEKPAALQEKLAQNSVTLGKIDKALELLDQKPNSVGMQNILGDAAMQRLDPGGVEVRAMIADIGGQKIHDRSGAAVTVGESERLKPYVPSANDSAATVKKKLKLFRAEYADMQQAIQSGASISQAAKPKTKSNDSNDGWSITPK